MTKQNIHISIATWSILKVILILLLFLFAYFIRDILLMVFIAIIFASIIEPIVTFLESKKIPRSLGVLAIFAGLIVFIYITLRLLIPPIIEQIGLLIESFPSLWQQLVVNFPAIDQYSTENGLYEAIQGNLNGIQSGLSQAASGAYVFVLALFQNFFNFLMILVISFYLVVEKDSIHKLFNSVAPVHYHQRFVDLFHEIQLKIGDWARGQLVLGLIVGSLSLVGLIFLLPKYALVLALVAGLTELIPYIGPILGAIPAVFLGFTAGEFSLSRGLMVLALYVVIQQLENNYLVPKVMQKAVGLSPVVIIIIMLIGAQIAGIIGLIIAIPVATSIGLIVKDFVRHSRSHELKDFVNGKKAEKI